MTVETTPAYRWQCLDCGAWETIDGGADGLPTAIQGAQDHADEEDHDAEVVRVVVIVSPETR